MATQKGWKINVNRCFSCRACEMACKVEYGLSAGEGRRRRVTEKTVVLAGSNTTMPVATFFIPSACNQCDKPACVKGCARGALVKTTTKTMFKTVTGVTLTTAQYEKIKGIVLHDPAKCIGCRRCEAVCPYGAPQYNPTTKKVHKCELCWQRVAQPIGVPQYGPEYAIPACVRQCGGSLSQRNDSSLPARGNVDLKNGPALELVTVETGMTGVNQDLGQTFTGESEMLNGVETAVYYRAGAGSSMLNFDVTDPGSGRNLGSKFLSPASLTLPALRIRNRRYINRDGQVIS